MSPTADLMVLPENSKIATNHTGTKIKVIALTPLTKPE